MTLELVLVDDYAALSLAGADLVTDVIRSNPSASLVVATGNTPMGVYRELGERRGRGEIDTSRLRIFQLDAYLGVSMDDPRSLYGWMERSFLTPLGISSGQVVSLPGDTPDPDAACREFDRAVQEAGGFDLAILGLGPNGHLGFNEPPADPGSGTRVVDLTPESVASGAVYWGGQEQVPRRALTAGMADLLAARRTLLLVSGEHKREILRRTVAEPISPQVPASYLQKASQVTIIADRAAASSLPNLSTR
jgi:glucosamine-6-phosphate deaminase